MFTRPWLIAVLLSLLVVGCGQFGHSVQRTSDPNRILVVNLGTNRYVYSVVRYDHFPASPTPARPTRDQQPGDQEIATITVTAEYSGWGGDGLRTAAGEF